MNQHEFNVLLEKYLAGTCSEEEAKLLQQWSEAMLDQSAMPVLSAEKAVIEQRLWARIRRSTFAPASGRRPLWRSLGVAASFGLAVLLGAYFLRTNAPLNPSETLTASQPTGVVRIENTSNRPRQITLEDGSKVILQRASRLSYPEHFGSKNRSVMLVGEAFFDVKRDPTKPFVVQTGELVTEVLGTSFTIRSYENRPSIEVRVATGRVSVYENRTGEKPAARNGVILTPNQRVVFDKSSRKLVPGLVDDPVILHPPATPQPFQFEETPLPQVFRTLERAFGVEIVLENETLAGCRFTADLTELPLYDQLDLICKSVNATYERRGTVLFVKGDGCP